MQDNTNTWATLIDNATGEYRIRYASGAINPLTISTTGLSTFNNNVIAKGTGSYHGFIADNSSSATVGGGYFLSRSFGITRGIIGVAGAVSGTADNNIAIFAEGGTGMGAIKFMTNGSATPAHTMAASGNLLIGTNSDVSAKIYIVGSASYGIVYQNTSNVNNFYVGVGGDGYLRASAWSYGSDIRMKENISDIYNGLEIVSKLKPKHFDYIDGQKNNLGFIAQDIQLLIPQAVSISDEKTGMLALKTDFIVPYLVKAIQELKAELDELKNKN
jgi:hypothetical protein